MAGKARNIPPAVAPNASEMMPATREMAAPKPNRTTRSPSRTFDSFEGSAPARGSPGRLAADWPG